jgi:hypothetical protein
MQGSSLAFSDSECLGSALSESLTSTRWQ